MFARLIRTSVQAGKLQGPCNLPNQSTLNLELCCARTIPFKFNLADHIDERGCMQLLKFFCDHQKPFPTLWILVQKEASRRLVEVGCERLFGLSGYVSSPQRSRLGVRNYERLAMLSSIVQNVYVDVKWVAEEYLRCSKLNKWKKADDNDALKCFNCERILDAEQLGLPTKPAELTMADIHLISFHGLFASWYMV
jgi:hypothetical protein